MDQILTQLCCTKC